MASVATKWHRDLWADAVWSSDLRPNERLVALCYADHAGPKETAWVTTRRLQARTGLSNSAVKRARQTLIARGWLDELEPATPSTAAVYALAVPTAIDPFDVPVEPLAGKSAPVQPPLMAPVLDEPAEDPATGHGQGGLTDPPPSTDGGWGVTQTPLGGLTDRVGGSDRHPTSVLTSGNNLRTSLSRSRLRTTPTGVPKDTDGVKLVYSLPRDWKPNHTHAVVMARMGLDDAAQQQLAAEFREAVAYVVETEGKCRRGDWDAAFGRWLQDDAQGVDAAIDWLNTGSSFYASA